MAYARRGKKSYKKRRSYRRSSRRKNTKLAKTVKRIVRRAVSKDVETKVKYDFRENLDLAAPLGAVWKDELTVKILKGLGGRHRLGREITLSGIRFKHIIKARTGIGPIYVRWCIMEHIGKNAVADSPFITTDREEQLVTFMDGAQAIFSQINTKKWRYLMGDSYKLLPNQAQPVTAGDESADPNYTRYTGGTVLLHKDVRKKLRKKVFYPEVERSVDSQGRDYWSAVEAERPIYLFAFARCLDNEQSATVAAATMHYELQIQYRDA